MSYVRRVWHKYFLNLLTVVIAIAYDDCKLHLQVSVFRNTNSDKRVVTVPKSITVNISTTFTVEKIIALAANQSIGNAGAFQGIVGTSYPRSDKHFATALHSRWFHH
nr:hypothetical protein [Nostoc sp. ChiQUE01b]